MKIIQSGEWIGDNGITQQMLAGDLTPITTEVNLANDPAVRNIPTLNQFVVTAFPANTEGFTFRF